VFREIDKLVAEQINKVRIKRLEENHAKGSKIKVRRTQIDAILADAQRPFF
jgi:hypothetical protein